MNDLEKPEVLARAVVDVEGIHPGGPIADAEAAKKIREKIKEDNPRSAEEFLANRNPLDKRKRESMNERIGVEVGSSGRKKRNLKQEKELYNRAKTSSEKIENFIENGTISPEIESEVKNLINTWPEAHAFFSGLPAHEQNAIIEEWLKDPRMIALIRRKYDDAMQTQEGATEEEVREAQRKYEEAREKETQKGKELKKITSKLSIAKTNAAEFDDGSSGGTKGAKQIEIEALEVDEASRPSDIRKKAKEVETLERQLRALNDRLNIAIANGDATEEARINGLIGPKDTDLTSAETELDRLRADQKKLQDLRSQKDGANRGVQTLEQQEEDLKNEIETLKRERLAAQADMNILTKDKNTADEQYVSKLEDAFRDSLRELMIQRIGTTEASRRELLDKEIEDAGDDFEKRLKEVRRDRWTTVSDRRLWRGKGIKYNEGQITSDYQDLLTDGPDQIIERMLGVTRDATGKITSPTGLTEERLSELKEGEGKEIVKDITRYRLQTKGITKGEAEIIASQEWGTNLIQDAAEKNKDIKNAVEAAARAAGFTGSVKEFIKRHPVVLAGLVPLILFMLYGGGIGISAGLAAKGAATAATNLNPW